ncbi:alpha/beta hydrolase [Muricoccus vinaceus]|uniref:Alpha/beta hydrolase n=1 Tax=Muricoccus vinaceus TaxID=424704 RepID=A0ABV6IYE0_9PROT
MTTLSRRGAMMLPFGLAGLTAACAPAARQMAMNADPTGRADPEMLSLLESYARLNPLPIETLGAAQARQQPSLADAVRARALEQQNINPQRPINSQQDLALTTVPNALQARIYRPITRSSGPLPVILYFHGGGWVIADIETYDASARALCAEAEAIVVSVHYRQGPEVRFPGAHDDANLAYAWLVTNAAAIGGDPNRLAIVGESAGGNLALNAAIFARDRRLVAPRTVVAIYPVGGVDLETPSYTRFANAKPLNKPMIQWFVANYTTGPAQLQDPRLDIVGRADLAGLPPVLLVNAEIDPLASDGDRLADKLRAANVPVTHTVYPGVTHEFFGADAVLTKAKQAQRQVGEALRTAFSAPADVPTPPRQGRRRAAM